MAADRERALYGRWLHSYEEDTEREMVLRAASHPFPPSRGRTSFEFRPDGTYLRRSPGPVDVPEESMGRWSLEGSRLVLGGDDKRSGQIWEITAVDEDALRVKK